MPGHVMSTSGPVPLEVFLAACQKSLARAQRAAVEAANAERGFASGERPLYAVEALELEIAATVGVDEAHERVLLDMTSSSAPPSTLRFRVEQQPLPEAAPSRLQIASLDPLGQDGGQRPVRLAGTVDGVPAAGAEITVHVVKAGHGQLPQRLSAKLDRQGVLQLTFPQLASVRVGADADPVPDVTLDGSGPLYVWATWKLNPVPTRVLTLS